MTGILQSLHKTLLTGTILAIALLILMKSMPDAWAFDYAFFQTLFRYFHVLAGVMWIGLLWYLNFIQIPNMPKIPDDQKPAISKVIAPAVLFWFRWAALVTVISGLIVAYFRGYVHSALLFGYPNFMNQHVVIGIGMWLGLIMAFNVWFIIWPNQKKVLGIIEADADTKAKSANTAMLFSRTNTLLSIPMLLAMVSAQNLY